MSVQIYSGNLSYRMSEESLRELFEEYGEVSSVKIIKDRESGRSRGFGFVEMSSSDEAESAIQQLNGTEIMERNIRVNIARPKSR
ncbi:MAG: RNA-binding protein [bacterium]|nr:RNA-binding protein [bacterium]